MSQECSPKCRKARKVQHKSGAKLGSKWMASPVNFEDVRITNVHLHAQHRYLPMLTITDAELQKGPGFYVSLEEDKKYRPNFTYTNGNMVREDAYIRCLGRLANQGIG